MPPRITVADTIGAGDSFMAAMLSWSAACSWPAADELDFSKLTDLGMYAAGAAAVTCSRPGADPPRPAELPAPKDDGRASALGCVRASPSVDG